MTIRNVHFFTSAQRMLPRRGNRSTKRGYILVMLSLGLPFLLGVTGMAIDIGRMYITKSEVQHFADSASMAAALQLNGQSTGITAARTAVTSTPLAYGFGQTTFASSNITTTFSNSSTGPFTTTPPSPPTGYNYVQVLAQVNVNMTLMRILIGPNAQVAASAIAGWQATTSVPGGEFPFSPYTRAGYAGAELDDPTDPYGYAVGNEYTLRWGAPGDRSTCKDDTGDPSLAGKGSIRGYCCTGSQSASDLRATIVSGQTAPVAIGSSVPMVNGAKDTEMSAIAWRVNMDTDTTSTTYAQYVANGNGNGERVVMVPVNSGAPDYINVGFAGFFLETPSDYSGLGGNDSACAIYIGQYRQGSSTTSGSGSLAYHLKLFQ